MQSRAHGHERDSDADVFAILRCTTCQRCVSQMQTRGTYLDNILFCCTQVPLNLLADGWHFEPAGFQVFATAFADGLVEHLVSKGIAVRGFVLLQSACVCGASVLDRIWLAWLLCQSWYSQLHAKVAWSGHRLPSIVS
jgi:hypothetical protein